MVSAAHSLLCSEPTRKRLDSAPDLVAHPRVRLARTVLRAVRRRARAISVPAAVLSAVHRPSSAEAQKLTEKTCQRVTGER